MNKTPENLTQKFVTKLGKMMSLIPIIIFQELQISFALWTYAIWKSLKY